jgi:tRNA modification GTPase
VAFAQAEGALSHRLQPLRERLEEWIARGEAAVEFVEESETHLPAGSLFNRLLARDRAIVTALAGTTRDTLEEPVDLDGIPVRLIDTAGLRDVSDEIESEGVRRARRAWREADLVLFVLDGSRAPEPSERETLARAGEEPERTRMVVVASKCDLAPSREWPREFPAPLRVSAVTGEGLPALRAELRRRLVGGAPVEDPILTDRRHAAALERTHAALERAAGAASRGLSEELLLEDLREALRHLGEITGESGTEALYDRIFSTFCIGK